MNSSCVSTPPGSMKIGGGGVETKTVDSRPHLITIAPPLSFYSSSFFFFFHRQPTETQLFPSVCKAVVGRKLAWIFKNWQRQGRQDEERGKRKDKKKRNNFDETWRRQLGVELPSCGGGWSGGGWGRDVMLRLAGRRLCGESLSTWSSEGSWWSRSRRLTCQ